MIAELVHFARPPLLFCALTARQHPGVYALSYINNAWTVYAAAGNTTAQEDQEDED